MKSLYIHIPFCKSICSYCDFAKMFYNENLALSYLDELSNEVNNNYKQDMLETIYIGGGTPSILSKKELNKLFSITNKLNIEPNYEFTIEANIADINEEFLSLCKSNKVNRLSIGIETINDKFLPQNNENILKRSIDKLLEIVFNPLVENDAFKEEYVKQEKENIKRIIEGKAANSNGF